jgi:hypothetical protein
MTLIHTFVGVSRKQPTNRSRGREVQQAAVPPIQVQMLPPAPASQLLYAPINPPMSQQFGDTFWDVDQVAPYGYHRRGQRYRSSPNAQYVPLESILNICLPLPFSIAVSHFGIQMSVSNRPPPKNRFKARFDVQS